MYVDKLHVTKSVIGTKDEKNIASQKVKFMKVFFLYVPICIEI